MTDSVCAARQGESRSRSTPTAPYAAWLLALPAAIASSGQAASAATVHALRLPPGFTISPESDRRLMTVGADGTVYAIVSPIAGRQSTRALRWSARGAREIFSPIPQEYDDQSMSAPSVDAIAPARSATFVSVGRTHDGAYIGTRFTTDRWIGGPAKPWRPPDCAQIPYASTHVYAADANALALTVDPSSDAPGIDLDDPASVDRNLPRGVVVDGDHCTPLEAAVLTGIRGASVVGFLGYLDGHRAPWWINLIDQQIRATRWLNGEPDELGPGVPFATTSGGIVAGATALPGHADQSVTTNFSGSAGKYDFATPHAVFWKRNSDRVTLFAHDERSIAWDIDAAETIVGMVQDADGKRHAFRRLRDGGVALLDALPHPAGWRFESAYAIGPLGEIAGIGRYDGIATAFVWRADSQGTLMKPVRAPADARIVCAAQAATPAGLSSKAPHRCRCASWLAGTPARRP